MPPNRPRQFRARVEALEPREMLSLVGGRTFLVRGKGTDMIVSQSTISETTTANTLRAHTNQVGTITGVFHTLSTLGGPPAGSGTITVPAPLAGQIDVQLIKSTSSVTRGTTHTVDTFKIMQGSGLYVGASGNFTVTLTQKINNPNATFAINGRVRL